MFESALIKREALQRMSESEVVGQAGAPASVATQIGMIREAALTFLDQLELLRTDTATGQPTARSIDKGEKPTSLHDEVRRFEIELISNALFRTHGHQQKAARLLGIKGTTLNSKIKRYNIMLPFFRGVSFNEGTEGTARVADVVEG